MTNAARVNNKGELLINPLTGQEDFGYSSAYRSEYRANELANAPKMQYDNYVLRDSDKNPSIPYRELSVGERARLESWDYQQASNLSQSLHMAGFVALPAKVALVAGMTINGVGNAGSQYIKYGEIKYPAELAISLAFGAAEGYLGRYSGSGLRAIAIEAGIGASSNIGSALTNNWYYKNDADHRYNLLSEAGQGAVIGAAGKYGGDKYVIPFIQKYYPIK